MLKLNTDPKARLITVPTNGRLVAALYVNANLAGCVKRDRVTGQSLDLANWDRLVLPETAKRLRPETVITMRSKTLSHTYGADEVLEIWGKLAAEYVVTGAMVEKFLSELTDKEVELLFLGLSEGVGGHPNYFFQYHYLD